jgi:two-component system sensor histidine kinase KdpD
VSADARAQGSAARGRLRIYLGYAPGAGTTCALLREGRRRAEHGTDVVVASAETHGRPHTEDLLAGLEVIPSAKVPYPGTLVQEMDLGAVLARGPEVALVDDFAHDNAPGSRHRARWQDIQDLLAAGIDVISTVSAGQLDSLADVVAKITGAAPRQTVPDSVVRAAAEVELVDVTPEALRDRLARGHIYPADQVEAALGGWFRTGNLSALRELALLWLAAALAGAQRRYLPGGGDPASGQDRERVVVALSGGPEGETLIRRAARIAARSGGDLLAVHAARPGRPASSGRAVLAAQRRLAESAGGTYHQLADEDIPAALLAFAHAHHVTQLVLGATPRTWRTALRPAASIRSRVIRRGGGLDVHIVTCTPAANGVPAAACEPQHRKRTVMRQQNTSWPGRVRQAARRGPRRAAFG